MANFQIPLDIPDVEILSVERNKRDDYILTVQSTKSSIPCRKCGNEITQVHELGETVLLRHLPILDKQVYIRIKPVRYRCRVCDDHPTTTEQADWYTRKSQMTTAYEKYLMRSLIGSTVLDVSRKEGVSYDNVEGALQRQIATETDWNEFTALKLLGLDEIALKKGHKDYVVIVSTRVEGTTKIIAVLDNRKKIQVKSFLEAIPERLRVTVKTVCSDMYDGYVNAAKEVFGSQAMVIIDRFHVAKNYRKSVDTLRKKELKRLKKELTDEAYKKLKGTMWALRKKEEKLTEEEDAVLKLLFEYSPSLKKAYALQNTLTEIFNQNYGKNQASAKIHQWINSVKESGLSCFNHFLSTLKKYWNEILNYFYRKNRRNSGFVEGLNNKIKIIKRRCYGIFDVRSLYQRIYLDLEGFHVFVYSKYS